LCGVTAVAMAENPAAAHPNERLLDLHCPDLAG
jgi:hypothetical protein